VALSRHIPLALGMNPVRSAVLLLALLCACHSGSERGGADRLVFVYQPLGDDERPLEQLLDGFRRSHPEVTLEKQLIPSASDVAHQYFLTALEGGSTAFDVFVVDVVWVPEFARAGWIAELSDAFPAETLRR
jgi:multiple sugar transport system substrate-binding protein